MLHTIENDYLRVSVDDHGAELCSIFDKVHNIPSQDASNTREKQGDNT